MTISWNKPPAVMAVTGDEHYLRRRWLQHLTLGAYREGYEVIDAGSDGEVIDALSMAGTFGQPTMIRVAGAHVDPETVKEHLASKAAKACIVMEVPGSVSEKKHPAVGLVKKKHQFNYSIPARRQDQEARARKFEAMEAHRLTGDEKALSTNLAKAMVKAIGTDLGVLAYEMGKVTALVRSRSGSTQIEVADVTALIRGKAGAEMQPIRDALAAANPKMMAKALSKMHRKAASDPTMLLLRARGGPADLAYRWLQAAMLLERGTSTEQIVSRLGSPAWVTERTTIPAAKKWGTRNLVVLVRDLAHADRGLLRGIPAPWVACEAALLRGCSSVGGQ